MAEQHWGAKNAPFQDFPNTKIVNVDENYNVGEITMEETSRTIKKCKRKKAAGPDEVPMELFKEMDDDMLDVIREILNE